MRSLIVGDIHIKENNIGLVDLAFSGILNYVEVNKIKNVKFLGDIYNQRALIRTSHQRLLVKTVARLVKLGCCVDIVVGNHDFDSLDSRDTHSLDVLDWLFSDSVNIYADNTFKDGVMYLPYSTDFDGIKAFIDKHHKDTKCVYCHLPISGFHLTPFHKEKNGIPPTWFKGLPRVFAGHFHMKQTMNVIVYPGSLLINTYAEAGMRSILIDYDMDTNKIIEIDLKTIVPSIPLYHVVMVDGMTKNVSYGLIDLDNDYVKFVIVADIIEDCRKKHDELLIELKDKTGKFQFQYKTSKMEEERIPEHISVEAMFLQYVKEKYKDDEVLTKRGLEYIRESHAQI